MYYVALCICLDTIKNNHNYTFFLEEVQIIHGIILHFFKSYISKIYNDFSLYIYISRLFVFLNQKLTCHKN